MMNDAVINRTALLEILAEKNRQTCKVVRAAKAETRNALQTVYDSLNQGQQKQIVKYEAVKKLFDLYGVAYSE